MQNPVEFHKPIIKGTKQDDETRKLKKQVSREQRLAYKTRNLNSEAAYWGALAKKRANQRTARGQSASLLDMFKKKPKGSRKTNIKWFYLGNNLLGRCWFFFFNYNFYPPERMSFEFSTCHLQLHFPAGEAY